jgi:protein gp37
MAGSKIEWTEDTWNPTTGCTKVSPGCKNCYAERMAKRLQSMGMAKYAQGFQLSFHEDLVKKPLSWKKPRRIFVDSMSDLFHKDVPDEFIKKVFDIMTRANWHEFQVLTKRSERLPEVNKFISWPDNVWLGVSVENSEYTYRIDHLRATDAKIKFLSLEPLLGPLPKLDLSNIDWVIVGGESGPGARRMESAWVIDIRDQCIKADVPFFFKQWGGVNKKRAGRTLEGTVWENMPAVENYQQTTIT